MLSNCEIAELLVRLVTGEELTRAERSSVALGCCAAAARSPRAPRSSSRRPVPRRRNDARTGRRRQDRTGPVLLVQMVASWGGASGLAHLPAWRSCAGTVGRLYGRRREALT